MYRFTKLATLTTVCGFVATTASAQNLLTNGDFESDALTAGTFPNTNTVLFPGGGVFTPTLPTGWTDAFGDGVFVTNGVAGGGLFQAVNHTPGLTAGVDPQASLRMFGNSLLVQNIPASEGDQFDFSVFGANVLGDPILSPSLGFMFIDFKDAGGSVLVNASGGNSTLLDSTSPSTDFDDVDEFSSDWVQLVGQTLPAPAGTASADVILITVEFGGAHSFDDAVVTLVGGVVVDGDANGDGDVDLLDFDILAGNFGAGPGAVGGASIGDFNGDGNVDLLDFDILAGNFGFTSPSAVPEPASIGLLGLGAAALLRRRRA
ncbi:MAG: PEP-CTERM sorting domain-containing protein [Planctomycetota bacterium]